ncbi:MAG: ATP-binding cassette domain-containing protein [Bifidobacteriaceae bacterium]|jgi:oligopeptide transport system ATP-binding protein|nr:ATP-binding cassette domain-containing protein [Bifidobacteriaceae bacterium]
MAEPTAAPGAPLLQVSDLSVEYRSKRSRVLAVDRVSLDVRAGETVGLIGESGSGKSSFGRAVLRLTPVSGGSVVFDGEDLLRLEPRALRRARRRMQMIFQDPMSSMSPRMTVAQIVAEPIRQHLRLSKQDVAERVDALLESVGLGKRAGERRPHEFSGGQRQRVAIARALSVDPDLVVCDEPTSALDVSIQAQILQLLEELQRARGLAILFISHDLGVVWRLADRVAVMQSARIVEAGGVEVFNDPQHPYTRRLVAASPRVRVDAGGGGP